MTAQARLALAGFLTLVLAGAACDRTNLTSTHGRAYRQAFAVQTVNPDRQTDPKAVHGLDSQEAAIIANTYRKGLGPAGGGGDNASQQLLTYSPKAGLQQAAVMSPPSSPGN
jgi:hypothetical protein